MDSQLGAAEARPVISKSAILDAMPLSLVVFDEVGIITYASPSTARLLNPFGNVPDLDVSTAVLGRNIMEFVHPDDSDFADQLMTFGAALDRQLMGPLRLRFITACGTQRYSELWAENRLETPGISGHIVIITEETSHHHFTEAVTKVAQRGDFGSILDAVADAMSGHPMEGRGLVLERGSDGMIAALSTTDLPSSAIAFLAPIWELAIERTSNTVQVEATTLPQPIEAAWADLGITSFWSAPLNVGRRDLQLVCLRRIPGAASPNQVLHLHQASALLRMAFAQESQRLQLEHLAYHDALTGLYNRAFLYAEVAGSTVDDAAVLFVDLDRFKGVNDRHGHDIGDRLLRRVAAVLMATVREDDIVARIGGDEFVIVCRPPNSAESMQSLATRIIEEIANISVIDDDELAIGASIGIVHHRAHLDFDSLISEADAALYVAKARGRGRWWMAPTE